MNRRQLLAGTGAAATVAMGGWAPFARATPGVARSLKVAGPALAVETLQAAVRGTVTVRVQSMTLRGTLGSAMASSNILPAVPPQIAAAPAYAAPAEIPATPALESRAPEAAPVRAAPPRMSIVRVPAAQQ